MDGEETQQRAVPVIEEELVTGTRAVKTGSVRVRKEVERTHKTVEVPAMRDVVSVNRVTVNREVETIPDIREEGDTLIVPVVEEELVVYKKLVLKEEIHIQRRKVTEQVTQSITLDREHATIERVDRDGMVIAASTPVVEEAPRRRFIRRRGVPE